MSVDDWINAHWWSLLKMVWPFLVAGALASVSIGVWMTRFYALVLRGVNDQHRVLELLLNHRHDSESGDVTFDAAAISSTNLNFPRDILRGPNP